MNFFSPSLKPYIIDDSHLEEKGFIRLYFLFSEAKKNISGLAVNRDINHHFICRDKFGNEKVVAQEDTSFLEKNNAYLTMNISRDDFYKKNHGEFFPLWDRFKHGEDIYDVIGDAFNGYAKRNQKRKDDIAEKTQVKLYAAEHPSHFSGYRGPSIMLR